MADASWPVAHAVLDRARAAAYIGVGTTTLAELTATRGVPSLRIGKRRLYRIVDLDAWLAAKVETAETQW
jgi:excisionase family DNA binding protein